VAPIAKDIKMNCNHHFEFVTVKKEIKIVHQNKNIAPIFTFSGMEFPCLYVRIILPKTSWFINQLYSLSELLANKTADSSRNGVVGSRGKNMPKTPKTRLKQPKTAYTIFT